MTAHVTDEDITTYCRCNLFGVVIILGMLSLRNIESALLSNQVIIALSLVFFAFYQFATAFTTFGIIAVYAEFFVVDTIASLRLCFGGSSPVSPVKCFQVLFASVAQACVTPALYFLLGNTTLVYGFRLVFVAGVLNYLCGALCKADKKMEKMKKLLKEKRDGKGNETEKRKEEERVTDE